MPKRLSLLALGPLLALALAFAFLPSTPAKAAGAANVQFTVNGTLPTFPCPNGCATTFSGTGNGTGHVDHVTGSGASSVAYDATFTVTNGTVTGSASYTEPRDAFCPAFGSAGSPTTGSVTLTGGATGVMFRSATPHFQGTVTGVTFTLGYSYHRVGVTPVLTITGGTVKVSYNFPVTGNGYFIKTIARGAGAGYFTVNTTTATQRCATPGQLPFTVIGDVLIALT